MKVSVLMTRVSDALLASRLVRVTCALALACGGVGLKDALLPQDASAAQTFLSEKLGYDNDLFIANMEENAQRYLGTPYSIPKRLDGPGKHMDCSSFVGFALTEQAGVDPKFWASLAVNKEPSGWPGTESLNEMFVKWGAENRTYTSVDALLQDNFATKGDIVFVWPKKMGNAPENGGEAHVGFFWGDDPSDNKLWHSTHDSPSGANGNVITGIEGKVTGSLYYRVFRVAPRPGWIQLTKVSANEEMTAGNSCYSLKGAVYGVFSDSKCSNQVTTLTTGKGGVAEKTEDLQPGTYYVKELEPSKGYALDDSIYAVRVNENETTTVNLETVADVPQSNEVDLLLAKVDAETEGSSPLGAGSLADAQFTVDYYAADYESSQEAEASGNPTRSWVVKTDDKGQAKLSADYLVSGDELYLNSEGKVALPLGTVVIRETLPPVGYTASTKTYVRHITSEGTAEAVETFSALDGKHAVAEQVIRGDLKFTKRDADTKEAMGNVEFRITSATTGESHVIVTNAAGEFSSASSFAAHSANTNANDDAATEDISAENGLWFNGRDGKSTEVNDDLGALPYDKYTIQELPCVANDGRQMVTYTVTIDQDMTVVDLGFIDDPVAHIHTTATDGDDGDSYVLVDDEVTIMDKVEYEGLIEGKKYTLEGKVVTKDTQEELACDTQTFTADESAGYETMVFVLSTIGLDDDNTVCFETLKDDKGRVIATHEDPDDVGQQCHVLQPSIRTTLTDDADGNHTVCSNQSISLTDVIEYHNLVPGKEYVVEGALQKKVLKDGKPAAEELLDAQGKAVTAQATFTPKEADGTVKVSFKFDGSHLGTSEIVAFETLMRGDTVVATHADLADSFQTVSTVTPEISTVLRNADIKGHATIVDEKVKLEDKVSYNNVQPDAELGMVGLLYDITAGKPLAINVSHLGNYSDEQVEAFLSDVCKSLGIGYASDDEEEPTGAEDGNADSGTQGVENIGSFLNLMESNPELAKHLGYANTTFTPDGESGKVTSEFPVFNAWHLGNHTIACFEVMYDSATGKVITSELGTDNPDQQMKFLSPEIRTLATDKSDGDHNLLAGKGAVIVDTVTFSNLDYACDGYDTEYMLQGALMDKDTGEPILVDGEPVTAEAFFTPENPEHGTTEVVFGPFDATQLKDKTIVVFEYLYKGDDEDLLASHEDLDSEDQSVLVDEFMPDDDTPGGSFARTGSSILIPVAAGLALLAIGGACIALGIRRQRAAQFQAHIANSLKR